MNEFRTSFQRLARNAGPIAVLGMFLGIAALIFVVLRTNAQTQTISDQGKTIVALQQAQIESGKTGRATLNNVAGIADQIKVAQARGATATVAALMQLDAAQRQGRADLLKKVGEMFETCRSLPCAVSTVNRILAEPVPIPVFSGPPAAPSSPVPLPAGKPAAVPTSAPESPTPSPSICPKTQIAPLNLLRVCIPP